MASSERRLCLNSLLSVFYDGEFSGILIDNSCKKLNDPIKKAFYTRLFLGTLENILFLDAVISVASKRKTKDIQRIVLNILRQSLYEIYFLNSVPNAATVSSALSLCEEKKQFKAKSFVNGVLRAIAREPEKYKELALLNKNEIETLSLSLSLPRWIIEYLSNTMDYNDIKSIFNNQSILGPSLRVNENRISYEDYLLCLKEKNIDVIEGCKAPIIKLKNPVFVPTLPGYSEGLFYVQELGGVKALKRADIKNDDFIIDVCASPGGKGLYAAELAPLGHVSMRDKTEDKVSIIRENADRLGVKNIDAKVFDATRKDESAVGRADLVIADLPCSGLGTIKNKPEVKYRLKEKDIEALSLLQREILSVAKDYVKEGGKLLYSTCTVSPKENEENTRWILGEYKEFTLLEEEQIFPDEKTDGFYYALLKRTK